MGCSFALRFFPLKNTLRALKVVLLPNARQRAARTGKQAEATGTTPFQAMASALGGSVGTANIAGTASAIAIGGAGAVFYMWLAALFGMALKFSEIVLAVKYRKKTESGYIGGPMLYIEGGLGRGRCGERKSGGSAMLGRISRPLAVLYAVFALLSSLIGTTLVQSNTVARSAFEMVRGFSPNAAEAPILAAAGLLCALLTGAVVLGGAKRIGKISALLVPFMAVIYIFISAAVLIAHSKSILPSIARIFKEAFGLRQLGGGICGVCAAKGMRIGISRGVYSNEAGVGSSAMAHAGAETDSPAKQGLYGIFEVFADTLVMCTLTALVVLASGAPLPPDPSVSGVSIALSAFSTVLGVKSAGIFLSVSLLLFAYTSLIGWSVYGLAAARYLFGKRSRLAFCIAFTVLTALGAFVRVDAAWKCGEMLNLLMAAPNIAALLLLAKDVKREIAYYE